MGLYRQVERLERASGLDPVAERAQGVVASAVPSGSVKDLLSGTWLGHPVHPLLITVPIGSWLGASVLDLLGGPGSAPAARRLVALGVLGAVPTAATGASDWSDTGGAERRVGFVHAAGNNLALALFAASWVARRRGRTAGGVGLALAGNALVAFTGYLGGHLAYSQGVGVDTTAFQSGPTEWTPVEGVSEEQVEEDRPTGASVGKVRLLLTRRAGRVRALAARCPHRGGPLDEGTVADGCVTCPWHGSRFSVEDGHVVAGPATQPAAAYEVQVTGSTVAVRRDEPRTLRTNPV